MFTVSCQDISEGFCNSHTLVFFEHLNEDFNPFVSSENIFIVSCKRLQCLHFIFTLREESMFKSYLHSISHILLQASSDSFPCFEIFEMMCWMQPDGISFLKSKGAFCGSSLTIVSVSCFVTSTTMYFLIGSTIISEDKYQ